jgi:hypothetical protein
MIQQLETGAHLPDCKEFEPSHQTRVKYIYIAGPYSSGDLVLNVRKAIAKAEELRKMGFVPFVPHLTMLWDLVCPHDVEYWYALDNEWLLRCDAVFRLKGWSKGADDEVVLANSFGIPVFYTDVALMKYAEGLKEE